MWIGTWPYDAMCPAAPANYPKKNLGDGDSCNCGEGKSGGGSGSGSGGNGASPGSSTSGDQGTPMVGDPINASTGNKYLQDDDYGEGGWLTFRRFYNSSELVAPTYMGIRWRHSFDRSLLLFGVPATTIVLARPDGRQETFIKANGLWTTDPDVSDTLAETDNAQGVATGYTVFVASLRHFETYDARGLLQSVVDQAGAGITLTYSTAQTPMTTAPIAGLLLTVTDPKGRQLNFSYYGNGFLQRVILPDGGRLTYNYDGIGNLSSVQYPDNSTRQYVYNESSLTSGASLPYAMTGIVDEAGVRYENTTFDSTGRATASSFAGNTGATLITYQTGASTIQYPLGLSSTTTFSTAQGVNKVASLNQPCGPQCNQPWQSRTYDTNGNPASYVDFNGTTTRTTYDTNGLLDQQVDASGTSTQRTTNLTWNAALRVPLTRVVLDANNSAISNTQWVYNNAGQTLARCDIDPTKSTATGYACSSTGSAPAGVRRWTYSYCTVVGTGCPLAGLILSATGPRTDLTQSTSYSYYASRSATGCGTPGAACYQPGDLYQVTDALGHVTTMASYDANGRVTRITDANGINTDMTYTPRGWLATRTVGGATTTITYTPYGAVASITDPDSVVVNYTYDAAHRLTKITDALGNYVQYTLDAAGNKTAEQTYDSNGTLRRSLSRTFNTLGQLTQVTDGLSHAVFNAAYTDSYDANGNLVHTADALGVQRKQGYDGLNRLITTIDNYSGTDTATQNTQSAFAYDANDRLEGVSDPDGLNTTYSYDGLGNATGVQSPDTGSTAYVYDAAGNVTQRTDAKGVVSTSTYDALNRRTATTYVDGTLNVAYAYDEANSVTGCPASYPVGRLTRIIETAVTTVYCYDAHGNVTRKSQTQGTVTDVTAYGYTLADRLASTLTPAGTSIQYSRDAAGRISGVTALPPGTSGAGAGNVVTAISYLPFGPIASYTLGNGQTITRTYDANYAVTDVVSPALNLHFARDAMGNITALGNASGASPATETYSYDPLYRLTGLYDASSNPEETYMYSKTGDRLSKTATGLDSGAYSYQSGTHHLTSIGNASRAYDTNGNTTGSVVGGNTYGFGYNGRNRMTVAQLNGNTVGTYTYNALGQRVAKTSTFPASTSQRFVYNENRQLLGEYGSTTRDYVMLGSLPVAMVDTMAATSTISYVTADGLNTPRAITDGGGNIIWQWSYQGNPFGEQRPTTTTGFVYNPRFIGQYSDAESGLIHNGYRDYEAARGGYEQSDPMGPAGGPNSYAYVESTPLLGTDPLGLKMGWAECKKLRDNIYRKHGLLSNEFDKFDPIADAQGGFPMKYGSGVTAPNGHRREMEDLQRGIKNDLEKYNSECNDDDDNNPPITRNVDALANKPIPCPQQPQPGVPLIALPPVLPAAEAASEAEGLLELIGVLIMED
nr:RHS repeat-associated core domain-containing protein [Dyella sp. ASV24]